ncbi:MAG TPA: hypothetical protein VLF17_04880 [Candidatus Nitrosotenuis sp.]|nr:hypothetical protein [Candidatus Nitrosotenuis sp.]
MRHASMYLFIGVMWLLILAGGGILVVAVSKIAISGYGNTVDFLVASVIKAVIAISFVIVWIVVLTKLKNRIFQKQILS